jgi:hypothetical protein
MEATTQKASMPLGKYKFDPTEFARTFNLEPSLKPYRILGCGFDPPTSSFYVPLTNFFEFLPKPRLTKRQVWGIVARFFDILGILAGCLLKLKIMRQDIDVAHPKAPWDFLLSRRVTSRWHAVVEEFRALRDFKIPRVIAVENEVHRIYMLFTDASSEALGAVLYALSFGSSGPPKPIFIMAKTKLLSALDRKRILNSDSQLPVAINKLELLAAVLGAKMVDMLKDRFDPTHAIYAWTDSINVARWLRKGPITGAALIDRKIQLVHSLLPGVEWKHVPGTDNPADLCSRPQSATQLLNSPMWQHGPAWMLSKSTWPSQPDELTSVEPYSEYTAKIKKQEAQYLADVNALFATPTPHLSTPVLATTARPPLKIRTYDEPLTDILFRDHTSWQKVVTSYVLALRWIDKLRARIADKRASSKIQTRNSTRLQREKWLTKVREKLSDAPSKKGLQISAVEYYHAEVKLLRLMQKTYEPKLFDTLSKNHGMITDGLTWCPTQQLIVSRSRHAATCQERREGFGKDLIHIPLKYSRNNNHYLNRAAELLMIQAHENSGHAAARGTLATFRTRYWVSKGTALAKWAKKRCPKCMKMDAAVISAPPPPLPAFRCRERQPFEATGLDFLGPLQPLQDTGAKTYILVLTCAYTRAVILRPVPSESAQSFVTAFNTIRHEWGIDPVHIISDRGSGFVSAFDATIRNAVELLEHQFPRITWHFNASRAPWWGGFFERFMFIIKDKLARCFMGHNSIYADYATFSEAVAYVMSVINARPLTWMSEDPDETRHPLCPQIFLNFHSKYNFLQENPFSYGPSVPYIAATTRQMKQAFKARFKAYNALFNMFRDNYVAELRKFRNHGKKTTDHLLHEGQVVLFRVRGLFKKDAAGDRRKWRLARIIKLHPSPRDGHVRSVDIEIYDVSTQRMRTLESQSIANLALLELDDHDNPL